MRTHLSEEEKDQLDERLAMAIDLCAQEGIEVPDDCKLTKERIRTIYVKMKFGSSSPESVSEYYGIPVKLAILIKEGRAFRSITQDLQE